MTALSSGCIPGCLTVAFLVIVSRVTADTPPFRNPPLALAVLEIRYPELAGGFGEEMLHSMRQAVSDRLPVCEPQFEEQIEVRPGTPVPLEVNRRRVLRFSARNRTTALLVKQDALIVETTAYAGWKESFRPLAAMAVEALREAEQPDGVQRVGLRYIDEIRVPSASGGLGEWNGYIDGHLLAAVDPEFIPEGMKATQWQGIIRYRTGPSSSLMVRYGPQHGHAVDPDGPTRRRNPPRPGPFFLLDSDSSWNDEDEVPEFDADSIMYRCDQLHAPVSAFFKAAVTDKLRDEIFNHD